MIHKSSETETRGFTLVELMIVVAILGVTVGLAMTSYGRTRKAAQLDRYANGVRDVINQARRRAIARSIGNALGGPPAAVIVDIRATTATWCDMVTATQTTCPSAPPAQSSQPFAADPDVNIVNWAQTVDSGGAVTKLSLPATLYFLSDGTADSVLATTAKDGFTLYFSGVLDLLKKRKLIVYPLSGRPRITDTW